MSRTPPAQPTVSAVIPTYDRLPLLCQSVASILQQEFSDLELIVADDGSVDGTDEYICSLPDPRVHYLRLRHTGTIARVRNAGASQAVGTYLCFLDSDDLWEPEKLAAQLEAMERSGSRWSYTAFEMIDAEGRYLRRPTVKQRLLSGNIGMALLRAETSVALGTVLMERQIFRELGGFDEDPTLVLREDHELMIRLALATETVAVPRPLAKIREHTARTTAARRGPDLFLTTARMYGKLLGRLHDEEQRRVARCRRAHHLRRAGLGYLRAGAVGPAARCFLRSIVDRGI